MMLFVFMGAYIVFSKYKVKIVTKQKMFTGFELLQPLTATLSSTFTDWKVNIRVEFLTTLNL